VQRYVNIACEKTLQLSASGFQERMQSHLDLQNRRPPRELLYPWAELDDHQDDVTFVGFGSLINVASAKRTLQSSFPHPSKPCLVFGAKRLYNRVMSERGYRKYGQERPRTPQAVLNVIATGSASDYFNGVLLTLKRADLEAFRTREEGYDLISVTAVPFDEPDAAPRQVYCLASRNLFFKGRRVLSSKLEPQSGYHALCEDGCAEISSQFLDVFRHTTWVSQAKRGPLAQPTHVAEEESTFVTPHM